ncbi:hypothetical protein LV89_01763 [Arcicella aurantiaca]|uniref:Uncharacterized protein n=1 Tax=Arcicella aurantiaca TaxID=591202 RepID=A0A316ECT4_9BACT|nr:hypothetical protein LV89_01763 [Arcicella aurantiaca]
MFTSKEELVKQKAISIMFNKSYKNINKVTTSKKSIHRGQKSNKFIKNNKFKLSRKNKLKKMTIKSCIFV